MIRTRTRRTSRWTIGTLVVGVIWAGLGGALSLERACASPNDAPVTAGLYDNAQGSPIVQLIQQAKTTLDIEIYEMDDPPVIAAVRDALNRGVIVHIVKEPKPVGDSCKVFDSSGEGTDSGFGASCDDQRQLVDDVNNAGGKYVPFAVPELCGGNGTKTCLEHGKIVVVDSRAALISSGNFNTTNLCDLKYSPDVCNRDYSYVTYDGAIASSLQKVVETDLLGKAYDVSSVIDPSAGPQLTVGPDSLAPLVAFIQTAQKSIQIQNQYLKEPTINNALIDAAKRGVRVEVNVASACSFGKPSASDAKKFTSIFQQFDRAGIKTEMFNQNVQVDGQPGYLHAKAIVIDGQKAWMGSVNGSTQGTTLNREFGVFFSDGTQVARLSASMSADFANPAEETWQDSLQCKEDPESSMR